jgi:hypothetical protein
MTTRLRKEYEEYEQKVLQEVHNGKRDFADYIFIMKTILDGPVMYFCD